MSMPLGYAVKTSLRKYDRNRWRTFFGIAPFMILVIILVIFTNLASSFERYIQDKIVSRVELKEEQIRLTKNGGELITDPLSNRPDPQAYTVQDLGKVRENEHVVNAEIQQSLPPLRVVTTELVSAKELHIQNIKLASKGSTKLYAQEAFEYVTGQPIPIILSKNVFNYAYIDMGGATNITLSQEQFNNEKIRREQYPLKNVFLKDDYDKGKLIGKTFSVKIGGFSNIAQLTISTNDDSNTSSFKLRTKKILTKRCRQEFLLLHHTGTILFWIKE